MARHVGSVLQNPDQQLFADTVEEEVAYGPKNLKSKSGA
jgi:energy-coupling factor transport system ATP-binding protein